MGKNLLIKKASGESVPFSRDKLLGSLHRAGASDKLADSIVDEIESWLKDGVSTKKIYTKAFNLLKEKKNSLAARYSLKNSIMELGPTGYPFEHLVAQLIKKQGYEIKVGQIVQGYCVSHEVDVIATSPKKQFFVECKFYNSRGKNATVKVPLYIHSRVNDIVRRMKLNPENSTVSYHGMIVTNTRFTSDAIDYGKCAGLHMISWDYPAGNSLKEMIERYGSFPITALVSLNNTQKQRLLDEGIVLCIQICSQPELLNKRGLTKSEIKKVLAEAKELACNSADVNS